MSQKSELNITQTKDVAIRIKSIIKQYLRNKYCSRIDRFLSSVNGQTVSKKTVYNITRIDFDDSDDVLNVLELPISIESVVKYFDSFRCSVEVSVEFLNKDEVSEYIKVNYFDKNIPYCLNGTYFLFNAAVDDALNKLVRISTTLNFKKV